MCVAHTRFREHEILLLTKFAPMHVVVRGYCALNFVCYGILQTVNAPTW